MIFAPGVAPSQSEPRFLGRKKTIAQTGWFQAWCHAKLWMKRASSDSCEEVAAAFLGPKMNPLNKAEIAWHSWNGWHQLRSHICSGMFRVEQFMLMFWEPGIVDHLMPLACQNEPRRSICYIHFFASKWIKMVHLWFFCCSEWFIYDFSVVQNGSFMIFLLFKMVHLWLFCCWKWFIYDFSVVEHGSFMSFLLLLLFSKMLIECCCAVDLGSDNAKTKMLQHFPRDAEYETRMILGWCFPWNFQLSSFEKQRLGIAKNTLSNFPGIWILEYQLEGKSGASSRGNSSSNSGILLRMTGLPSGCASGSALTSALDRVVLYLGRLTWGN